MTIFRHQNGKLYTLEMVRRRGMIETTMSYISDRWSCAFRLKWLIDGIEEKKI